IFPLPPDFAVGPLRIGIGKVRINGGHLRVRMPDPAMVIEVQGADVTARPTYGDLDVAGRLDALAVEVLGRREQLDRVAVDGRLSADVIALRRIAWRWRGQPMQLGGDVRKPWGAERELALRATGDVALGAIATAASVDAQVDGAAHVTAEI